MLVSVVQMNSGADKVANIAQARQLIDAAVAQDGAQLIALPELWSSMGGDRATRMANAEVLPPPGADLAGGPAYEFLRNIARERGVHIHGGSITEVGPDKLLNTTLAFDPQGHEIARYRKIHLFDMTTVDGRHYGESNAYDGGTDVVTYQISGIVVGCAICYDLRFPELFLALRRAGADLILLPSAFTVPTGRDHWEVLLRARAIETQCWLGAPALWGTHLEGSRGEPRQSYGQSSIVDPWGKVVATVADGTGWTTAEIDLERVARIRRDMPVMDHRKLM